MLGKIIDIIVKKKRLCNYFDLNNYLNKKQFGFRKICSTIQVTSTLVSDIVQGFEAGEHTIATLCDLSKAFDYIYHKVRNIKG